MPDFADKPLWLNGLLFAVAAAAVWFAGTRLERLADAIAVRADLGKAFVGLLLLAGATSLPEVATTVTASLAGYTDMAVHNLLGGVAMQTAILVVADAVVKRGALTRFSPRYGLLMQGVSLVLMLAIIVCWIVIDDRVLIPFGGVIRGADLSVGAVLLLTAYLAMLWTVHRAQGDQRWRPLMKSGGDASAPQDSGDADDSGQVTLYQASMGRLIGGFALFAMIVLGAGWAVAELGGVLAQQSGLGMGFVGATLVAITTSLPEVSTTVSAVRHANYSMAAANVFGSNMFDVMLLGVVDVITPGSIFGASPTTVIFMAGLGIVLTCIYLWGMLEHRDRTVWRIGWDSALVAVLYVAGIAVLYSLRDQPPTAAPPGDAPPSRVQPRDAP